jgi:DNA-directed RNA polymerase subunit RPC12/RpoP
MKDDGKDNKSDVSSRCPNCSQAIDYMGEIQSGMTSVRIYRCSRCKREFVEEELEGSEIFPRRRGNQE